MMPTCCCSCPPLFGDGFNRADEAIGDSPLTDSTGNWLCVGTTVGTEDKWEILSDTLAIDINAGHPFNSLARPYAQKTIAGYHRQLRASVSFNCSSFLSEIGLTMEVTGSATEKIIATAFVSLTHTSGPRRCGSLQIIEGSSNLSADVLTGSTLPLGALDAGQWHRLTMCIDLDTQLISAHIVTQSGQTFANHAHLAPPSASGLSAQCNAWLKVTQDKVGLYQFDDFSLSATKASVVGDGYGYGYGIDNGCPCCGPGGCEAVSDDFEDGVLECRWGQVAGTWVESGGTVHTANTSAILLWAGGWSGLDDDCLPDETTLFTATFQADSYAAEIRLLVDYLDATHYHYAQIALPSDASHDDGTLKLFSSTGGQLASVAVPGLTINSPITAKVCWDGAALTAVVGSVSLDAEDTPFGGTFAALGTGTTAATVSFLDMAISHNIYSPNCPGCRTPCDSALCDEVPAAVKIKITGSGFGFDGVTLVLSLPTCCDGPQAPFQPLTCLFGCQGATGTGINGHSVVWTAEAEFDGLIYTFAATVQDFLQTAFGTRIRTALMVQVTAGGPLGAIAVAFADLVEPERDAAITAPRYPCKQALTVTLPQYTIGSGDPQVMCSHIPRPLGGTATCEVWGE